MQHSLQALQSTYYSFPHSSNQANVQVQCASFMIFSKRFDMLWYQLHVLHVIDRYITKFMNNESNRKYGASLGTF